MYQIATGRHRTASYAKLTVVRSCANMKGVPISKKAKACAFVMAVVHDAKLKVAMPFSVVEGFARATEEAKSVRLVIAPSGSSVGAFVTLI